MVEFAKLPKNENNKTTNGRIHKFLSCSVFTIYRFTPNTSRIQKIDFIFELFASEACQSFFCIFCIFIFLYLKKKIFKSTMIFFNFYFVEEFTFFITPLFTSRIQKIDFLFVLFASEACQSFFC